MKNADMTTLLAQFPLLEELIALKETTWFNPSTTSLAEGLPYVGLTTEDVQDAHARLDRFAPYLAEAFPETRHRRYYRVRAGGPAMKARLEKPFASRLAAICC
jgi:D-serine dehydratase